MLNSKIVNTSKVMAYENKDSYTCKEVSLFIIKVKEVHVNIEVI